MASRGDGYTYDGRPSPDGGSPREPRRDRRPDGPSSDYDRWYRYTDGYARAGSDGPDGREDARPRGSYGYDGDPAGRERRRERPEGRSGPTGRGSSRADNSPSRRPRRRDGEPGSRPSGRRDSQGASDDRGGGRAAMADRRGAGSTSQAGRGSGGSSRQYGGAARGSSRQDRETRRGSAPRGSGARPSTPSRPSAPQRPGGALLDRMPTGIGDYLGERAGDLAVAIVNRRFDQNAAAAVAILAVVALILVFVVRAFACSGPVSEQQYIQIAAGGVEARPQGEVNVIPQISRVTLSAVGDNLMHDSLNEAADAAAGVIGDGAYNYAPMYEAVRDFIGGHDINFIDQETILGGDDLGISGYPEFNTPECVAEQLAGLGWNLVTCATNHALDMGFEGVANNCEVWARQRGVTMAGTYSSAEDRAKVRTFEKGDITFSFLAYTDVINNTELPIKPEYAIAVADQSRMVGDIEAAKKVSDVVIVAMSWGDEDSSEVSASQRELAQLLADEGVDLVLGFGPHVIQPVEWVEGLDARGTPTGHKTLVVFSLGNFISNQMDYPENVEGCFTCAFELNRTTREITIADPAWNVLVNHIDGDYHRVYRLSDYTPELAAQHDVLGDLTDPIGFVRTRTNGIIDGDVVEIVE